MNRGRGFTPVAASAWKKLYLKRFAGGGEATSGTRFVAYGGSMVIDPWGTVIARARETSGVTLGVPTSMSFGGAGQMQKTGGGRHARKPLMISSSACCSVSPSVISLISCSPAIFPIAASWSSDAST